MGEHGLAWESRGKLALWLLFSGGSPRYFIKILIACWLQDSDLEQIQPYRHHIHTGKIEILPAHSSHLRNLTLKWFQEQQSSNSQKHPESSPPAWEKQTFSAGNRSTYVSIAYIMPPQKPPLPRARDGGKDVWPPERSCILFSNRFLLPKCPFLCISQITVSNIVMWPSAEAC